MKEIVFLNGKFISADEAMLSVLSPGFLYGWGLFETMRAFKGKIVYLDAHLKRIQQAAKLLKIGIPYPSTKLKTVIKECLKLNGFADASVRLTVWKKESSADILVFVKKYPPLPPTKYQRGFSAVVAEFRQSENSQLAQMKTTNYLFYQLAYQQAKAEGFDEAILLNNAGCLCEASRSNLFLIKGKDIFTPQLSCGCLAGITRQAIFDLAKKQRLNLQEGKFTLQDLYQADAAFLTNSLIGVMPLYSVEALRIGKGNHPLVELIIKKYQSLSRHGAN